MRAQLEQRLKELKTEFESGQKLMADLEARQANLRDSLLRLSGAIQVLQEELGKNSSNNGNAFPLPAPKPSEAAELAVG